MKGIVYVQFPKTGLGNLLLVWARAKVFAHINDLPIVTSPWWGFRLGAWVRGERKKRLYWGYFKEDSWVKRLRVQFRKNQPGVVHEPPVAKLEETARNHFFLFDQVITDNDLFGGIREYRDFIREELYQLLAPRLLKQLNQYEIPVIGIHIRRGDFKLGNPLTPLSFFIEGIHTIRSALNEDLPVTVFTDAAAAEVKDVLSLPNVRLAEDKPDILDILLMSKSKFIILSQSSTFSYWGAFLSDAFVIRPSGDWQKKINIAGPNSSYREICWQKEDEASQLTLLEGLLKWRPTRI